MTSNGCFPKITTDFSLSSDDPNGLLYHDAVQNILQKTVPSQLLTKLTIKDESTEGYDQFNALLPLFTSTSCEVAPSNMSFFMISKYRANAFQFFIEMISHWLVPGKRLNLLMIYAADFRLPEVGPGIYTICQVMVQVETPEELDQIKRNLPIIEVEVRLGIESSYYARRILEIKGLTADAKTAQIQEYIAYLIKRKPHDFDFDVLTEMQHVLVMCHDQFKAIRDCQHLSRIISIHYLFRKALRKSVKVAAEKRHLSLKLFKAMLRLPSGNKKILAVLVGINFMRDKEVFEKTHLLNAIQNYIPSVQAVENSFFANRCGTEHICTLYLEVEKSNGEEFSSEEIKTLRRELPLDLKDRIEYPMHPIFMPPNEEEIMRNILSLSNQIKYLHDVPQVCISFDEQTANELFFTVVLVRILKPCCLSIQTMFKNSLTFLEYLHDRCKTIGFMRKKYPKEANVFRVKVSKEQFLRRDHSIDLYKARQTVALELWRVIGEFRDFNGGMIAKQQEVLSTVRALLAREYKYNDLFLENFFFSFTPVTLCTVIEPLVLKKLFVMLLESIETDIPESQYSIANLEKSANFVYILIKSELRMFKEEMLKAFGKLQISHSDLAHCYIQARDLHYFGCLYRCNDSRKQDQLIETLGQLIQTLKEKTLDERYQECQKNWDFYHLNPIKFVKNVEATQ